MPEDDAFAIFKNWVLCPVVTSMTTLITKVDIYVDINEFLHEATDDITNEFIDNDMNDSDKLTQSKFK